MGREPVTRTRIDHFLRELGQTYRGTSLSSLSAAFEEILPRLETESLRVDEKDFRRKYDAFLTLAQGEQH